MLKKILIFLISATIVGSISANSADDPVVIKIDGLEVHSTEFEERFGFAMVIRAIQARTPIKDQNQIQALRLQFLEQRLNEVLLLEEAARRGINIPEPELSTKVIEFVEEMGWQDNQAANLELVGLSDESRLVEIIREKEVINRLIRQFEQEIADDESSDFELKRAVREEINNLRDRFNGQIFPGRVIQSGIKINN